MKIGILQHNFIVGDVAGNAQKIRAGYLKARESGAELVVSTELALLGYPPRDLLERPALIDAQLRALGELSEGINDVPLIVGFAEPNTESRGKPLFNAAAVLHQGKVVHTQRKALLPTYDVFDEYRYFEPYKKPQEPPELSGKRIGVLVCEDIWNGIEDPRGRKQYQYDPVEALSGKKLDALIVINGSPYWWGKGDARFQLASAVAKYVRAPVIYSNQVGGNDELIFDGRSFAVDKEGACIGVGKTFEEDIIVVDCENSRAVSFAPDTDDLADVESALILGLRDYLDKVGKFPGGAVIGLSGGIDSALVACLAARALGKEHVLGVSMPSPFSSRASIEDAKLLAQNLGIALKIIPIEEVFRAYQAILKPAIGWFNPPTTTEENIQARIRGMILMAIANRERRIVLGTGNKSELAMGYATLYGDMAAGLGVISDLPKTLVYRLARFLNQSQEIIPRNTIEKPPSAELRPNQKDTDSLPPYDELDPILHEYLEERKGPEELVASGYNRSLVERVVKSVDAMEFKRRQMAPGLKVTTKAFGTGRRMPIAAKTY